MAIFVCEEKTFWKGRLYKPGERISFPAEHADKVPHHFARVDEGPEADGPMPELVAAPAKATVQQAQKAAPAKATVQQGYDPREVAFIAGLQSSKRHKMLAKFNVNVPGNSSTDEIAKLIIDASRAQGVDFLHPTQRAKLDSDPAQPQLVDAGAPASPPARMADPNQDEANMDPGQTEGTPISDTLD